MPSHPDSSRADQPRTTPLHEAKLAIRRDVLAARDATPEAIRAAASRAISRGIQSLPGFAAARTVLLTFSFRSEWDTTTLVESSLAAGKTVAAPRVNRDTRMLELHAIVDLQSDVAVGAQGIPEPLPHTAPLQLDDIDWVLVPGVAFDPEGGRLGYGGGYYDRLLPLIGRAKRVAGAFELQIVPHVPAAPHDLSVDTIVTEAQMLNISRPA